MTGDRWVGFTCTFITGLLVGMSLPPTEAKTYDEKKAEELAKHREMRRAIERKYESCATKCRDACRKD